MKKMFELSNKVLSISSPLDERMCDLIVNKGNPELMHQAQSAITDVDGIETLGQIYSLYHEFSNVVGFPLASKKDVIESMQRFGSQILDKLIPNEEKFNAYVNWVRSKGNLYINHNKFDEVFIPDPDKPNTEAVTYTRGNYTDLATMSMLLRMLHPMWEAVAYKQSDNVTSITLLSCLGALKQSQYVMHSRVMDKLIPYIMEASKEYDVEEINQWQTNISSEDWIDYALAKCLIDRLTMYDFSLIDNDTRSMVSLVWNSVGTLVKKKKGGIAKPKTGPTNSAPQGNSKLEEYKAHVPITAGSRAIVDALLCYHWYSVVEKKMGSHVANDVSLIRPQVLSHMRDVHSGVPFERSHKIIAAMFFHGVIAPNAFDQLRKDTLYEAFSTVLSVMIAVDMREVACAFASRKTEFGQPGSKLALSKEMIDKIDALYPPSYRKIKNNNSPGVQIIHDLYTDIAGYSRIPSVPAEQLKKWGLEGYYNSSGNLKDALAEYMLMSLK